MKEKNTGACYRVAALSDNYIWLLCNALTSEVAVIDPGESGAVLAAVERLGLVPTEIVNTHHHPDHIDGNEALRAKYNIPLIAPAADAPRIAHITTPVRGGDCLKIAGFETHVIATPGHTLGHVAFYCPHAPNGNKDGTQEGIAFVGDTLFSLGCGRVFEGTMAQMWASLKALRALPDDTLICSGHEYSAANADYTESLGWSRPQARLRIDAVRALRQQDKPTLPVRLGVEKAANPFLNCDADDLKTSLGMPPDADADEVFAALRHGKDRF